MAQYDWTRDPGMLTVVIISSIVVGIMYFGVAAMFSDEVLWRLAKDWKALSELAEKDAGFRVLRDCVIGLAALLWPATIALFILVALVEGLCGYCRELLAMETCFGVRMRRRGRKRGDIEL
jgi:hypothetical protein